MDKCAYCEDGKVLKSANFCGGASMKIVGKYIDVTGDKKKIPFFGHIYEPSFPVNYCPMCGKKLN